VATFVTVVLVLNIASGNHVLRWLQNKIMWQPPMEGEDMDEMGSGTEQQQQQQPVSVDKNRVEVGDVSTAPQAQTAVDKVRL